MCGHAARCRARKVADVDHIQAARVGQHFHAIAFGVITLVLQVFVPYRRLAPILMAAALLMMGWDLLR